MVRHMLLFVLIIVGIGAYGQQPAIPPFNGTVITPDSALTVDGKGNITAEVECIEGVHLDILTRHNGIVTVASCQDGWWVKYTEPDVDWGSQGNGGADGIPLLNSVINQWSSESINGWTDDIPSYPDAKVHFFVSTIAPVKAANEGNGGGISGEMVPCGDWISCYKDIPFTKIDPCLPSETVKECYDRVNPPSPVDVPAVVVGTHMGFEGCGGYACFDHPVKDYACIDKSRILLPPDGNGKHWCHKVQQ